MTDTQLTELESLLAKATARPWRDKRTKLGHPNNQINILIGSEGRNVGRLFSQSATLPGMTSLAPPNAEAEANTELICAAVNALPTLLAEVRRLRGEVEVMRQALKHADEAMCRATFAGGVDRRDLNYAIDRCRQALARVEELRSTEALNHVSPDS